jgi:spermidine synthase
MSDTPAECHDHWEPYCEARLRGGHVLIHGLGLGMLLNRILRDTECAVTVVEKSADVIQLVAGHYTERHADRLTIVEGDALTWQPPRDVRYTVVWHDIWDNICADNLPDMHRLHRRFGRRCDWQGSWSRAILEAYRC